LQDVYSKAFEGTNASPATIRQLKRELFHAIWQLLLDKGFLKAYQLGILLLCADGILRRLFPRFFIYSADYPEKYVFFYSMLNYT
jgi:hypothetical protein